jgi:subtilisin-like proprotein convertase family protein
VGARLVPTGWYAGVLREEATYPDLGVEEEGESDAPHYQVSLSSDVPVGHKIGLALEWETDQRSGTSEPFFLDVGAPACQTVPATDVPQAIVDQGVATSNLSYGPDVEIVEIQVAVDISHTYIGDLIVRLVSPSGTSVFLHNRAGGQADDIVGTYGLDLTPAEPLSILHGEPSAGTWQLEISDKQGGDSGTLNSWSVAICGAEPEGETPEMRFREITAGAGGTMLRWWTYPGLDSYRVYRATDPSSAAGFVDVTAEDGDPTDTWFEDSSAGALLYYLVTGVGPAGEGPLGHFDQ